MNRIMVDPSMGSAETEYGSSQTVDKAFDEYTDGDGQYYCSLTGHPTGWLQYEFSSPVTLSRYGLEEGFWLTPRDWTFEGSNDGTSWEVLDEQSGHDTWYTGEIKEFELGATSKTNAHVDYCVECTCSGYDSKRSKYYGCRRQNRYDCNKGFCVRCQQDGVTPMPGFYTRHNEECSAYSNRVERGDGAYIYYKLAMMQWSANSGRWCVSELSFYDTNGEKLILDATRGSAKSTEGGNYSPDKAFDGISYQDATQDRFCSKQGLDRGWLLYEFPSPTKLSKYSIQTVDINSYAPLQWKLQGSNDGISWDILDEQAIYDNPWTKHGEVKEFEIKQTEIQARVTKESAVGLQRATAANGMFQVIGITHMNAVTIFAIIGALSIMFHCLTKIHQTVFKTTDFQKINKEIDC